MSTIKVATARKASVNPGVGRSCLHNDKAQYLTTTLTAKLPQTYVKGGSGSEAKTKDRADTGLTHKTRLILGGGSNSVV